MTKASDNIFPKVTFVEGSAPSSPSASDFHLYFDSADHLLKWKNSAGAVVTIATGSSGAPSTSKYITAAADAGLSAEIVIPGLAGSPDIAAGGGSDDEFDALSGWTTWGSLGTLNVSDVASHVHMVKSGSGTEINGIYKACPSLPFTVTIHIADAAQFANFDAVGLFVTDATPAAAVAFTRTYNTGGSPQPFTYERSAWTNRTTRSSVAQLAGSTHAFLPYLRMIVTSSSSITYQISNGGRAWTSLATINPGFTAANAGIVIGPLSGAATTEAYVDWIRFI